MRRRLPLGALTLVLLVVVAAGVVVARTGPRRAAVAPPTATATPLPPGPTATALPAAPRVPDRTTAAPVAPAPTLGRASQTSGCAYRVATNGAKLPDLACTPGAANPELSRDVVCAPGFTTRRYRRVTEAQKRSAYRRYGIATHLAGEYEVDHLVGIEDGGANDDANLWPEPAGPEPGFRQKDLVESYVHRQVCAGALDLAAAQRQIASDWTSLLEVASQARLPAKQHTADGDESD